MSQSTTNTEAESEEKRIEEEGIFPLSISSTTYQLGFYIAILAFVVYLLVTSRSFSPDDRLFPTIVMVPAIFLILSQIILIQYPGIKDRFSADDTESNSVKEMLQDSKESEAGRSSGQRQKYEVLMLGWVIALPVSVYYLGFATVLPIYVFAFGWYFNRDVKLALIMSLGFSIGTYVLFIAILGLIPWDGVLGIPSPLDFIPKVSFF